MDDLRAAVDRVLRLTPEIRLITLDAADLVDAAALPVFAALTTGVAVAPAARAVVTDPLRLPLIAGLADIVAARSTPSEAPDGRLRELWRVLAPAGILILIVPLPPPHSIKRLILQRRTRRRMTRWLDAAMFARGDWQATAGGFVVRTTKRDGLAPPVRIAHTVQPFAQHQVSPVSTKTA